MNSTDLCFAIAQHVKAWMQRGYPVDENTLLRTGALSGQRPSKPDVSLTTNKPYTHIDVARMLNQTPQQVSRWLMLMEEPTFSQVCSIAALLDMPPCDLLRPIGTVGAVSQVWRLNDISKRLAEFQEMVASAAHEEEKKKR